VGCTICGIFTPTVVDDLCSRCNDDATQAYAVATEGAKCESEAKTMNGFAITEKSIKPLRAGRPSAFNFPFQKHTRASLTKLYLQDIHEKLCQTKEPPLHPQSFATEEGRDDRVLLRVIQWNIQSLRFQLNIDEEIRHEAVANLIVQYSPDVVILQEFGSSMLLPLFHIYFYGLQSKPTTLLLCTSYQITNSLLT
jgi:hypothetical protein